MPDRLAVHDDVQHALDAAEAEHDPLAAPAAWDRERAAVDRRSDSASGTFGGRSANGITTFV